MFKIISAEIKKMVSKPGVFVLAVLLAVVLVLGVVIYKPEVYKDTSISLLGDTFSEKLVYFDNSNGLKVMYDNEIEKTTSQIANYKKDGKSYKDYMLGLLTETDNSFRAYRETHSNSSPTSVITEKRENFVATLQTLQDEFIAATRLASNGSYPVITTKVNQDNFESTIVNAKKVVSKEVSKEMIADVCKDYNDNYAGKISECVNNLIFPSLPDSIYNNYYARENSRYSTVKTRQNAVYSEILELQKTVNADITLEKDTETLEKLKKLANEYASITSTYVNLVKNELLTNAFSFTNTKQQMNLMYLDNEDSYNANTNLIKFSYLFTHNLTDDQFAHPLTIGVTSNHQVNGYDYTYFVLKLFSFIIIAYAVMAACHTIAGEVKEGTMRYLAIRPVNRTKLLFGKLFSIVIMSLIMIIFSTIIALCVGGVFYGLSTKTILTIFNGSVAITMHPTVMILVYILSLLIELIVYASIALLLSCLFKSDLFAMTVLLLIYLINILLPAFVSGANSWLAYYPFSHISLYSLFGSSIYANTNSFFSTLLGAKIYASTSLWLTLFIIILIVSVVNIISIKLFKKKEL